MTGVQDFHTSVFNFATKVMTAVESQLGGSDRTGQVTAAFAFAGNDRRVITISHSPALTEEHGRCVVVWGNKATITASGELDAHGKVRSRAGPHTRPIGQGTTTRNHNKIRRINEQYDY